MPEPVSSCCAGGGRSARWARFALAACASLRSRGQLEDALPVGLGARDVVLQPPDVAALEQARHGIGLEDAARARHRRAPSRDCRAGDRPRRDKPAHRRGWARRRGRCSDRRSPRSICRPWHRPRRGRSACRGLGQRRRAPRRSRPWPRSACLASSQAWPAWSSACAAQRLVGLHHGARQALQLGCRFGVFLQAHQRHRRAMLGRKAAAAVVPSRGFVIGPLRIGMGQRKALIVVLRAVAAGPPAALGRAAQAVPDSRGQARAPRRRWIARRAERCYSPASRTAWRSSMASVARAGSAPCENISPDLFEIEIDHRRDEQRQRLRHDEAADDDETRAAAAAPSLRRSPPRSAIRP